MSKRVFVYWGKERPKNGNDVADVGGGGAGDWSIYDEGDDEAGEADAVDDDGDGADDNDGT